MIPLPALPECRWRGEPLPDGSLPCRSPLVRARTGLVAVDTCAGCRLADKVPRHVEAVREPSWVRKGINYVRAQVEHAAAGRPRTPPREYEERVKACQGCEYRTGPAEGAFGCKLCGCNMREKARMAEQRCPHPEGSRWPLPTA